MTHTQATTDGAAEAACELAALYALGALDREEARAFEEHLGEGCGACAAEVEGFADVCAEMALASPPRTPPAGARARLLARLAGESPAVSAVAEASDLLVVRAGEGEWVETSDPGVSVKLLFVDREHDTYTTLVRMSPGARVPAHRHRGAEQCLVLEGDLRTVANVLHAGDFNCAPAGSVHDELTTKQGALLLIVAPESYEVLGVL